jgi:hypothetical protein
VLVAPFGRKVPHANRLSSTDQNPARQLAQAISRYRRNGIGLAETKALSDFSNSILLLIPILSSDDTSVVSQSVGHATFRAREKA